MMEVVKTYLFFSGYDEGVPHLVDTIFWQGHWWLVSTWLQDNGTGARLPEKLVRLTGLRFQEIAAGPHRFVLNNALPKSVYDGEARAGYVVATYQALAGIQGPTGKPH